MYTAYIYIYIYIPRMKAYDKAKEDKAPNPCRWVEEQNLPGYYRCCFYKWKKERQQHHWSLLCSSAPKMMKRCKEVPNLLKDMLGLKKKFCQRAAKESPDMTSILPAAFERVVADCVVS